MTNKPAGRPAPHEADPPLPAAGDLRDATDPGAEPCIRALAGTRRRPFMPCVVRWQHCSGGRAISSFRDSVAQHFEVVIHPPAASESPSPTT